MFFYTNTSPFAGQEGKLVQSNKIKERLYKETLSNVSCSLKKQKMQNAFWSKARGEISNGYSYRNHAAGRIRTRCWPS
ncbi:MAG: hypothetical protein CM1200mP28_13670 [Deltaproteobacteria bacterium]|nr:MAG: hypothetical protein CM1200mP28_13670 [Deltaproteobacteria bacterium]